MNPVTEISGKLRKLDHFALPAMDVDRAEAFYTKTLGGRVIVRDPQVPGGIFIKFGPGHHIGLFVQNESKIPMRDTVESYPRSAFAVAAGDFDQISTNVKQISRLAKNIYDPGIDGKQVLSFVDSEGNILELLKETGGNPTRIHHLHFETTDIDESTRFYTKTLNLVLTERRNSTAVLALPGDQAIVLHQVQELSEMTRTHYDEQHFAFYVRDDDFHSIMKRIHEGGIEQVHDVGQGATRRPGDLAAYFRDPVNGICLQILNRDSAYFAAKFGFGSG